PCRSRFRPHAEKGSKEPGVWGRLRPHRERAPEEPGVWGRLRPHREKARKRGPCVDGATIGPCRKCLEPAIAVEAPTFFAGWGQAAPWSALSSPSGSRRSRPGMKFETSMFMQARAFFELAA